MTKFFRNLTGAATLLAAVMLATGPAQAKEKTGCVNLGQLELNTDYDLSSYAIKDVVGTFTAPSDGLVTVFTQDLGVFASGVAVREEADGSTTVIIDDDSQDIATYINNTRCTFSATEGATYVLYGIIFNDKSLRLEMDNEFAVVGSWPAQGSVMSATGDNSGSTQVGIECNMKMGCGMITVATGEGDSEVTAQATVMQSLAQPTSCWSEIGDILTNWLIDGSIEGGDEFRVIFSDVRSRTTTPIYDEETGEIIGENADGELLGGTGVYTLTFTVNAKPISLVNVTMPEELLSYFAPGDPNGEIVLEFDGPVGTAVSTQVGIYAYGFVTVPYTTDGNKLIMDLRGEVRKLTSNTDGTVDIVLAYIPGSDGQWAIGNVAGAVCGSFQFHIPYRLIEADVYSEFTPKSNTTLSDGAQMEVYIHGVSVLAFDGFRFDFTNAGGAEASTVVALADVAVEADADNDEAVYTFAVPAEVVAGKNVTLTLNNLVNLDGLDHADDIKAVYNVATSGIEGITATADAPVTVYDLRGLKVLEATSSEGLKQLPAGLYIANGKKLVVR